MKHDAHNVLPAGRRREDSMTAAAAAAVAAVPMVTGAADVVLPQHRGEFRIPVPKEVPAQEPLYLLSPAK